MVTPAPHERQTLENSTSITPPPSTTTFFGTKSSSSAWPEVMTPPPISRPGSERSANWSLVVSTTYLADQRGVARRPAPRWVEASLLVAFEHGASDAARLDEALEPLAFVLRADDLLAVGRDPGDVDAADGGCDAVPRRLVAGDIRVTSLGMHAGALADVPTWLTGAAQLALLDECHRHPQLAGAECRGVAAAFYLPRITRSKRLAQPRSSPWGQGRCGTLTADADGRHWRS